MRRMVKICSKQDDSFSDWIEILADEMTCAANFGAFFEFEEATFGRTYYEFEFDELQGFYDVELDESAGFEELSALIRMSEEHLPESFKNKKEEFFRYCCRLISTQGPICSDFLKNAKLLLLLKEDLHSSGLMMNDKSLTDLWERGLPIEAEKKEMVKLLKSAPNFWMPEDQKMKEF